MPLSDEQKSIADHVASLPQPIQDRLLSTTTGNTIREMSELFGLDKQQQDQAVHVTYRVLMGMTTPDELSNELREDANMKETGAQKLADELYDTIVKDVEDIIPFPDEESSEEVAEADAPPEKPEDTGSSEDLADSLRSDEDLEEVIPQASAKTDTTSTSSDNASPKTDQAGGNGLSGNIRGDGNTDLADALRQMRKNHN